MTPDEPEWVWNDYLAVGNMTLFSGKPKAGKSRLALDLTTAAACGAPSFLGRPVVNGPVIYISEEGAATLAHKLPHGDNIRILTRETRGRSPNGQL